MSKVTIPSGHQTIMPYLILEGALKFIDFTEQVFDATITVKKMRDDHTLMHSELQIGGSTIMFADSTEQWGASPASLFIYVLDADEVYQKALQAGATTLMDLSDQGYGRTCGVVDPFGNTWWITSLPDAGE